MEIVVTRQFFGSKATIGSLFVNDQFVCYTLEDVVREIPGKPVSAWKIYARTAIPRGRYEVIINLSPHLGYVTPYLLDVPGYQDIRIHIGNYDTNTEGCLLVGLEKDEDAQDILQSKAAFDILFPMVKDAIGKGEKVYVTVG